MAKGKRISVIAHALEIFGKGVVKLPPDLTTKLDDIVGKLGEEVATRGDGAKPERIGLAVAKVFLAKVPSLAGKSAAELTPELVRLGIETLLKTSGNSVVAALAPLSSDAIDFIVDKYELCGVEDADAPTGPALSKEGDGRFVMRVFVEEDASGDFKLPMVTDLPPGRKPINLLMTSFRQWGNSLNLDIDQTGDLGNANMVVTSESFAGRGVDPSVLALTDIGPPGGVSGGKPITVRMVFDSRKSYTRAEFVATCTHEFGHAIGVKHRDVAASNQLMNPYLSSVTSPQAGDIAAALTKGWSKRTGA